MSDMVTNYRAGNGLHMVKARSRKPNLNGKDGQIARLATGRARRQLRHLNRILDIGRPRTRRSRQNDARGGRCRFDQHALFARPHDCARAVGDTAVQ
jgi:hypothetical protein